MRKKLIPEQKIKSSYIKQNNKEIYKNSTKLLEHEILLETNYVTKQEKVKKCWLLIDNKNIEKEWKILIF